MKKLIFLCFLLWSRECMAEVDKHLLNEMLTTINNEYLEKVDNAQLITAGTQALTELDPSIMISKGSSQYYIYRNRQIYKIVPFPKDITSIPDWVETISQLIETAEKISNKVTLKDFAVPDLIMQKMTSSLDDYSHYYSEYEYNEEEENNAIYTLYSDRMIGDILYIRMRIFNKQSAKQFKKSVQNHPNATGLILDLRGNSGGIFNEALKIADFLTDGAIITYTSGREDRNTHYYTSKEGTLYDGPLAIIVDGKTASAAEVLAGGLQEQSRAQLIGSRTFGKGTIQNITTMSNGGKLVLTTEQFFTPSGKTIHKKGIIPNVCLSEEEKECLSENRAKHNEDVDLAVKLLKNEL